LKDRFAYTLDYLVYIKWSARTHWLETAATIAMPTVLARRAMLIKIVADAHPSCLSPELKAHPTRHSYHHQKGIG
jgi:hypothetical protein